MAMLRIPWCYEAFIWLAIACTTCWSDEKYLRTFLYNTNPAQSLCSAFSRRNSQTKNRSKTKVASPEASSVLPGQDCLCYHFAVYPTSESCSQGCSRSLINGHFKNVVPWALIHITQIGRLLLQLLDPMLSSHLILDYRCGIAASSLCRCVLWGQSNWIAS